MQRSPIFSGAEPHFTEAKLWGFGGGQEEEKRIREEKSSWLSSLLGSNLDKTKTGNVIVTSESYTHATIIQGMYYQLVYYTFFSLLCAR